MFKLNLVVISVSKMYHSFPQFEYISIGIFIATGFTNTLETEPRVHSWICIHLFICVSYILCFNVWICQLLICKHNSMVISNDVIFGTRFVWKVWNMLYLFYCWLVTNNCQTYLYIVWFCEKLINFTKFRLVMINQRHQQHIFVHV